MFLRSLETIILKNEIGHQEDLRFTSTILTAQSEDGTFTAA